MPAKFGTLLFLFFQQRTNKTGNKTGTEYKAKEMEYDCNIANIFISHKVRIKPVTELY